MISERNETPRTLDEAGWPREIDDDDADSPGIVAALAGVLVIGVLLWALLVLLFSLEPEPIESHLETADRHLSVYMQVREER